MLQEIIIIQQQTTGCFSQNQRLLNFFSDVISQVLQIINNKIFHGFKIQSRKF